MSFYLFANKSNKKLNESLQHKQNIKFKEAVKKEVLGQSNRQFPSSNDDTITPKMF